MSAGNDSAPVFLTAEWRDLVMVNFDMDPNVLSPLVPCFTELDQWNGRTFVSVVGFMFKNTRILGVSIPGHTTFPEVNLRFYVRHRSREGWRRGVVFVKEIVPRRVVAWVARTLYNEPYVALPMRQCRTMYDDVTSVTYTWKHQAKWGTLDFESPHPMEDCLHDDEASFVTEHYWGYTRQKDGGTIEYAVEHPRWSAMQVGDASLECDIRSLYGEAFVEALSARPSSAFLCEGSPVLVRRGRRVNG